MGGGGVIVAVVRLFPDMSSHLGGWQHSEEERIPHSPSYWYAEILQCYSERREQGGCGAHRKRACSSPALRDEVRGGDREELLQAQQDMCHSLRNSDTNPLNLQHRRGFIRLHLGCDCQY